MTSMQELLASSEASAAQIQLSKYYGQLEVLYKNYENIVNKLDCEVRAYNKSLFPSHSALMSIGRIQTERSRVASTIISVYEKRDLETAKLLDVVLGHECVGKTSE